MPTAPPCLPSGDVTLVTMPLDPADDVLGSLETLLSAEERARAGRLVPPVRRRFVAGRGQLRLLLGGIVAAAPQSLEIVAGPAGKPELGGPHAGRCHFNVSHSGDRCLVAVSAAMSVGVDLERVTATHTPAWADTMAGAILAVSEQAAYRQLPGRERPAAVLEAWVAKEAVLKASGHGVAAGVRHVVLPTPVPRNRPQPGAAPSPAALAAVAGAAAGGWAVCLLDLDGDLRAALACPRDACTVALLSGGDAR